MKNQAHEFFNSIKNIETITERLRNVQIDNLDFRQCIRNWDDMDAFFYLDPPYYGLKLAIA